MPPIIIAKIPQIVTIGVLIVARENKRTLITLRKK
jgi:hypothetical protein